MVAAAVLSLMAGLAEVVGGTLVLLFASLRERQAQLMALGTGLVLGAALFTMLPEAMVLPQKGSLYLAIGLGVMLLVGSLAPHRERSSAGVVRESAAAVVGGLILHSMLEGAALGAAAQVGGHTMVAAVIAIMLHKIPEGFSVSAIVWSALGLRSSAFAAVSLVGFATVAGACLTVGMAQLAAASHMAMAGVAAGSFLYVGCAEMLPAVRRGRSVWLVLIGMVIIFLLTHGTRSIHFH